MALKSNSVIQNGVGINGSTYPQQCGVKTYMPPKGWLYGKLFVLSKAKRMLNYGDTVQIGQKNYVVVKNNKLPCIDCALRDCFCNRDYDALKAGLFATSCVDMMPTNAHFEEVVEQPPQVDCK